MALLVHEIHVRRQTVHSAVAYQQLSTRIPRPLSDGHGSYTVPFERWTTAASFAATFRVPSLVVLRRLVCALRLPDIIRGFRPIRAPGEPRRYTYCADALDALAVLLARLAFPGKLCSLKLQLDLDWSVAKLSAIIKATVLELHGTWRSRALFDERVFMDQERLNEFASAITRLGCPINNCVGFLDGTTFHITRPGGEDLAQAVFYSGHKRYHCLRWQGAITPDGMVSSFYGPCPERQGSSNPLRIGWPAVQLLRCTSRSRACGQVLLVRRCWI